jgi:hypothetical protein
MSPSHSERSASRGDSHAKKVRPPARGQCLPASNHVDERALILASEGGEAGATPGRLLQGSSPESEALPDRSDAERLACS